MFRLYAFFTQNSMKTLYVLEELGVDFEFHYVDLLQGENRVEGFERKNPFRKVPVLEHNGEFLFESGAICRYVASAENSSLYPQDKMGRAQVDQWMDFFSCHLGRWLTTEYFEKIMKPRANIGSPDEPGIEEARKFSHRQFKVLERCFEESDYLAGEELSIADLFAFAYVEQFRAIEFPLDDYPRARAWFDRIESRDSIARARARFES